MSECAICGEGAGRFRAVVSQNGQPPIHADYGHCLEGLRTRLSEVEEAVKAAWLELCAPDSYRAAVSNAFKILDAAHPDPSALEGEE